MAGDNAAWQLEDFVDSLVVDLDKTRETLAVKAINKPLTYTVKELSLDLNIFPTYDGDTVRVHDRAARPAGCVEGQHPARLDHRSAGARDNQGARGERRLDRRHQHRQGHEEAAPQARRAVRWTICSVSRRRTSI